MHAPVPFLLASLGFVPLLTAAPATASFAATATAPSANAGGARACVTEALTPAQIAAGEQSVLTCYDTYASSLRAIGLEVDQYASPSELLAEASAASGVLATHYDFAGSSTYFTVTGADCNGGGVSLPGTGWDNRVGRTVHGMCGSIKHWDNANLGGDLQATSGQNFQGVNLTSLDNRSSSISYYS